MRKLQNIPSGRPLGLLMAGTGMFLVSSDSLFIRIAQPSSGWTIAFMAGVWSIPVVFVAAWRTYGSQLFSEIKKHLKVLCFTGLLASFSTTAFTVSVTLTSVSNVVAILASAPILAAFFARLTIREYTSPRTWRSIFITGVGVLIIVGGSMSGGGIGGDLLALAGISGYAFNLTIWRRYPDLPRILVVLAAAIFIVVVTSVPASPSTIDRDAFLATLAMGASFGPLARFLLASSTRYAPAAEVSLFTPIETVCASIWAWLFFSEVPANATVIGAIVIVSAVTYGITGPASEVAPELEPHP